jgi:alpha-beta hydrolase superfamily lysophospholipase
MTREAEGWRFGAPVTGYAWCVKGAKANLLLMHGYGEYARRYAAQYNQLIPALNAAGFNVYAFDARGHGASPGLRGATDMKQAVNHHMRARQVLAAQDLPLFLFGHSLGGLITAASIANDSRGVGGVVLSAPALQVELNPALRMIAGLTAMIAPGARLTPPLEADAISRDPQIVEAYRKDPYVITRSPSARLGATVAKVHDQAWKRFSDWHVPVLLIHGDSDRLTPVEGSIKFFETIPDGDKQIEIFKGGYHELLNDDDKDRALAVILDWLRVRTREG